MSEQLAMDVAERCVRCGEDPPVRDGMCGFCCEELATAGPSREVSYFLSAARPSELAALQGVSAGLVIG